MSKDKGARIYDFGTGRMMKPGTTIPTDRIPPEERAEDSEASKKTRSPAVAFVCSALFFALMFIRPLVRFVLKVIGVPAGLAAPLVWFAIDLPNKNSIAAGLLALSFGAFLLSWFYDTLVFKLAPEPVFLNS